MARSLRLNKYKEWRAWCESGARPANVPAAPDEVYVHDKWLGYEHWLRHARPGPGTPVPAQAMHAARKPCKRGATNTGSASAGEPGGKQQRR